jgi:hypothetical protein
VTVSPAKSSNTPGGAYRKPRADLYTILLVIALLAILVAILFLYLHMQTYNFEVKAGPPVAMIAANLAVPMIGSCGWRDLGRP